MDEKTSTENKKPKRAPSRKIPPIVTKDSNNIEEFLRDDFEADEVGKTTDGFKTINITEDESSRTRTIDGSMLPRERFNRVRSSKKKNMQSNTIMLETAERFDPTADFGLNMEQVEYRTEQGLVNSTRKKVSKTYRSIFFTNIVTPINMIALVVMFAIIFVREDFSQLRSDLPQLFFMIIIFANMTIGIVQEIRAKKTMEKLSIMTAPTAIVIREGERIAIPVTEVVLDDVMYLENGRQICSDSIVLKGEMEVNEALLTGESVPVKKTVGSEIYSGSFVASGNCFAKVNRVGSKNYVETLASYVRKYKKPKSELFNSVNLMMKIVIPIAVIISVITFVVFMFDGDQTIRNSAQYAGAIMVGMLPAGMFLLTSSALVVSVIRLSKRRTLVKDLYCIEMLARVDVLCLDKTGTITDGSMKVREVVPIKGATDTEHNLNDIIGSMLTATGDNNQTAMALADKFGYSHALKPIVVLPFSSTRKLAAVSFADNGTYLYGAPEFVLKDMGVRISNMVADYASQGLRVMALAHSPAIMVDDKLPAVRRPVCLLAIEDNIREDAIETIQWFKENEVSVKVISGDNPITVAEVARRVGVANADLYISLDGLSESEVMEAANKYTVFGRVSPEQKMLLVRSMKQKGRTVAMTGDGVNDILAMRESDCSVAIASGAEAARNVAHLVLQDSNFTSMPQVVMEGRRVINNIQSTSVLYLMKTVMVVLLALISLTVPGMSYPYRTNMMIPFEVFIIAAASFALAMQPNDRRVTGKFLTNVVGRSAPAGITLAMSMIAIYIYSLIPALHGRTGYVFDYGLQEYVYYMLTSNAYSSMLVLGLTFTGFMVLIKICEPPNLFRVLLLVSVGVMLPVVLIFMPQMMGGFALFGIDLITYPLRAADWMYLILVVLGSYFFMAVLIKIMKALKLIH